MNADSVNLLTWEWTQPILVGTILLLSSGILLGAWLILKGLDAMQDLVEWRK